MDNKSRFKEPDFFEGKAGAKLPIEGKRNILITSALPYVNNVPHLGNIIGAVLSADVFSRYCRMQGHQTLFVCGTDEYGTATEMKALTEGVTPKEICDKFFALHKQVYEWFGIDFDHFGRTTTEHQTEIAQNIFLKIHRNGFTSIDTQKQLHCGKCQKFLADRFVSGICPHCKFVDARGDQCDGCGRLLDGVDLIEPKCMICSSKPTIQESKHLFLNLDQLSPKIEEYLNEIMETGDSKWSTSAISITRSWLKMGLEKRCITRDLKWGTPVPLEEFASKVFYVWFDAPIGYLSITKSLLGNEWTRWWMNPNNVELFHFLGKDNVAFHSIIFPATLLATGEPFTRAKHICATEYLNYEDQKFSKSRGVGIFGDAVAKIGIPADVFRFYLLYMRPEGQDTSFCWDDFMFKNNSELLANLGNFVLRALSFLANNFGGIQPEISTIGASEEELFTAVDADLAEYSKAMEEIRMRDALQRILAISRRGNQYMQAGEPWVLVKGNEEEKAHAKTIIGVSANLSVLLSILIYPFMPTVSAQIREQCNLPMPIALPSKFLLFLKPGHQHNKPFPLFTKLEPAKIVEWKTLFGGPTQIPAATISTVPNGLQKQKASPTKGGNTKQQKTPKMAKSLEKMPNDEDFARMDADKLHAEVMAKFQKAKEIFVAKQMARLDAENSELMKQIEAYKTKLGYTGPLYNPPKPTTMATVASIERPKQNNDEAKAVNSNSSNAQQEPAAEKAAGKKEVKKGGKGKGGGEAKESGGESKTTTSGGDGDSIDIGRLDLRVGRILEAKKHPDADALYVEQIDLGEEKPRTVVSGLVRFVPIEEMQNRLVVCLCNLKPAKMRGVESQAMVMCASTPEKVEILGLDPACQPGDIVVCDPFTRRPDQPFMNPKKKIWETVAPDLSVSAEGECVFKGYLLRVQRTNSTLKALTLRNVPVK